MDPTAGGLPAGADDEVRCAFANLRAFLDAAGAGLEDVVRLTVLLTDDRLRDAVNREWLGFFPDEDSRPARHATVGPLRAGMRIQLEAVAVLPVGNPA